MTDDQIKTIRDAAASLRGAAAFLRAGRESSGIRNIRWAGEKIAEAHLDGPCSDGTTMIAAAIKAYGQGNDNTAASHADTAAARLTALVPAA